MKMVLGWFCMMDLGPMNHCSSLAATRYLTTAAGPINWCLWNKVQSIRPQTAVSLDVTPAVTVLSKHQNSSSQVFFLLHIVRQTQKTVKKRKSMMSNWLEFVSHSEKISFQIAVKTLKRMQAPPTTGVYGKGGATASNSFAHMPETRSKRKSELFLQGQYRH